MKKLLLILLCLPMIGFGQNVYIPDANFKAYLVGNSLINTNGDTEIQVSEATTFGGEIFCQQLNISNLTGIEQFTTLTTLDCSSNQITSLDVSQNTALEHLECWNNQITSLNASSATALEHLLAGENQITSLDVSGATALTNLSCDDNNLTSLDVSNNTALNYLWCSKNQLTSLDVSQNTALEALLCYNNQITSLDVSQNTALEGLLCYNNQLTCLDISDNDSLQGLYCSNNLLEQLNTQNGNWVNGLFIDADTNNLTCVEVDNIVYATTNWAGSFDSFVTFNTNCNYTNPCATVSAIQEHTRNKELLKVTDLLGREAKGTKNEVLFYIYDDGTIEKRIIIE